LCIAGSGGGARYVPLLTEEVARQLGMSVGERTDTSTKESTEVPQTMFSLQGGRTNRHSALDTGHFGVGGATLCPHFKGIGGEPARHLIKERDEDPRDLQLGANKVFRPWNCRVRCWTQPGRTLSKLKGPRGGCTCKKEKTDF